MVSKDFSTLSVISETSASMKASEDKVELDKAFIPLLATKVNPRAAQGGIQTEGELDLKTSVLCEVLELDETAMAAMNADERDKVLEEAKRNVTKFPDLKNTERVDVNRALVLLKNGDAKEHEEYLKTLTLEEGSEAYDDVNRELSPCGRYSPTFMLGTNHSLEIRCQLAWAEDEYPLSPPSPLIKREVNAYQSSVMELALKVLGKDSDRALDEKGLDSEEEWVRERRRFG